MVDIPPYVVTMNEMTMAQIEITNTYNTMVTTFFQLKNQIREAKICITNSNI